MCALAVIERQVSDVHKRLQNLVQISPEDIPGGIPHLSDYLKSVKSLQKEFQKISSTFSTSLIQNQALSRAGEVREERHALNSEVSEFILLANNLLSGRGIDEVSNVDIYSTVGDTGDIKVISDEASAGVIPIPPLVDLSSAQSPGQTVPQSLAPHTSTSISMAPLNAIPNVVGNNSNIGTNFNSGNSVNLPVASSGYNANIPQAFSGNVGYYSYPPNSNPNQPAILSDIYNSNVAQAHGANTGGYISYAPNANQFLNTSQSFPTSSIPISSSNQFNISQPTTYPNLPSLYPHNIHPYQSHTMTQPPISVSQIQSSGPNQSPQFSPSSCPFLPNISQATNPFSGNDAFMKYLLLQNSNNGSIEIFSGIAYCFHSWIDQIRSLIGATSLTPIELLRIFQTNCKDEPKNLVDNYLFTSGVITVDVFLAFWKELSERFGSPKKIADQIFCELDKFPEVKDGPKVGEQLRKLHDLCKVAEFNIPKSAELYPLHLSSGLSILKKKLTPTLRYNWLKQGTKYEKAHGVDHPPFQVFVKFLKESAADLSNKNYEDCLRQAYTEKSPQQNLKGFRNKVLYTDSSSETKEESSSKCPMHPRGSNHLLANCNAFNKLSLSDRYNKLKENRLCFKCFGNHMQTACEVIVKCEHCGQNHHSALHIKKKSNSNDGNVVSSSANKGPKTGKVSEKALCTKICEPAGSNFTNKNKIPHPALLVQLY